MIENERSTGLLCSPGGGHGAYHHRNGHINSSPNISSPKSVKTSYLLNGLTNNNNNNSPSMISSQSKMSSPAASLSSVAMAPSPSSTPKLIGALRRKTRPTQRNPTPRRLSTSSQDSDSNSDSNDLTTSSSPWPSLLNDDDAGNVIVVGRQEIAKDDNNSFLRAQLLRDSSSTVAEFAKSLPKRPRLSISPPDNNVNDYDGDNDDKNDGDNFMNADSVVCASANRNVSSNSSANNNDERCLTASSDKCEFAWPSLDGDDEPVALEELELFSKIFKQKRIKLGFTQGDVGLAMGKLYGTDFSQTTISRFEALNLSFKNMCKLKPLLEKWLADTENAVEKGTFESQILKAQTSTEIANAKRRKKRTSIEGNIRNVLEDVFISNQRPSVELLDSLAKEINMDREVVRVWFCNRRQKEKRLNPDKDIAVDAGATSDGRCTGSPSGFLLYTKNSAKNATISPSVASPGLGGESSTTSATMKDILAGSLVLPSPSSSRRNSSAAAVCRQTFDAGIIGATNRSHSRQSSNGNNSVVDEHLHSNGGGRNCLNGKYLSDAVGLDDDDETFVDKNLVSANCDDADLMLPGDFDDADER